MKFYKYWLQNILGCSLCICSSGFADEAPFPKLVVQGTARLYKSSDQWSINIGVVSEALQAEEALAENTQKMNSVIASLQKVGLVAGEYQTGRFNIRPTYTSRPKNPSPDWRPSIYGYEVTNHLYVKTKKMELISTVIDAANSAGANQISDISFGLSQEEGYRAEAITTAALNAIENGNVLAEAAGLRLVRIFNVSLDPGALAPSGYEKSSMRFVAASAGAPPIEAAEVEVTATVAMTYEVASK